MTELAGISKAPLHMKPGMSHVVHAGETLVIRDSQGQEIAVEAREAQAVLAFITAYASELHARQKGVEGDMLRQLVRDTEVCFGDLPARLLRAIPSHWSGIYLPS